MMVENALRTAVRSGILGRVATVRAGLLGLTAAVSSTASNGGDRAGLWIGIERVCVALASLEFDLRTLEVDPETRQSLALIVHAFVDVAGELADAFGYANRMEEAGPRFLTAAGLLKKTLDSLSIATPASPANGTL